MNLHRLFLGVTVIILLLAIDYGDGMGRMWRYYRYAHYAPFAAAAVVPVALLAPYAPGISPGIVLLLLLKILALKRRLLRLRVVGLGALVVGKGAALLGGGLGGVYLGKLGTLYVLQQIYNKGWRYPSWHKKHRGWGWRRRPSLLRLLRGKGWRPSKPGWKRPPSYYSWPSEVKTYSSPVVGGWGSPAGHSAYYSEYGNPGAGVSSSAEYSYPGSGASSSWGHSAPEASVPSSSAEYSYPGSGASSSWGHSAPEASVPYSSGYSGEADESSGWQTGGPPASEGWEAARRRRQEMRDLDTQASTQNDQTVKEKEDSDFMWGMAKASKDLMNDWFSGFTDGLMKVDNTLSSMTSAASAAGSSVLENMFSKRRVQEVLEPYVESEAFLENEINKMGEVDETVREEKDKLIRTVREAYMRSLLDELSIESEAQIPSFAPMPSTPGEATSETEPESDKAESESQPGSESAPKNETESKPDSRKKRDTSSDREETREEIVAHNEAFLENLIGETKEFFTLLSAFDHDTCMQKLVCEVHTRANEAKESSYDHNIVSMFKLVNNLLTGDYKGSSMKYREAAFYGEVNRSAELCTKRYSSCQYTTKEIIQMGDELD